MLRVDEREIECVGTPQEDAAETGHRLGRRGIDVDEGGRGADRADCPQHDIVSHDSGASRPLKNAAVRCAERDGIVGRDALE